MDRFQQIKLVFITLGLAGLTSACSTSAPSIAPGPTDGDGEGFRVASGAELVVITADGDTWKGSAPRIRIIGPLPNGTPAVAEVAFAAGNAKGVSLAVHFELDMAALRGGDWEVALDGDSPTRPGLGVLSSGSPAAPRSEKRGHLRASVDGKRFKGSFEAPGSSTASLASATFDGVYGVDCLVAEAAPALEGSVGAGVGPGAFSLVRDEKLESAFCAQFKSL
jgi:hypothetical protein